MKKIHKFSPIFKYTMPKLTKDLINLTRHMVRNFYSFTKSKQDGATFENYIFILEPHPYNEAILMSADYDGKVNLSFIFLNLTRSLYGILTEALC